MSERRFPIQGEVGSNPNGSRKYIPATTVPWSEAEIAYATYSKIHGTSQSIERMAERGGFGREEFRRFRRGYDMRERKGKVMDVPPLTAESHLAPPQPEDKGNG